MDLSPEQSLVQRFPMITWTEPQSVITNEGRWWTCRFCTALYGLAAKDLAKRGFTTEKAAKAHIREKHPILESVNGHN